MRPSLGAPDPRSLPAITRCGAAESDVVVPAAADLPRPPHRAPRAQLRDVSGLFRITPELRRPELVRSDGGTQSAGRARQGTVRRI